MKRDTIKEIIESVKIPLQLNNINSLKDLKSNPNNILLAYFLQNNNISQKELQHIIESKNIQDELQNYSNKQPQTTNHKYYGLLGINQNNFFVYGNNEHIISGIKQSQEHVFPSGLTHKYNILLQEQSANIPAFNLGFQINNKEIFMRELAKNIISIYHKIQYHKNTEEFTATLPSFLIAHELIHRELSSNLFKNQLEEELAVEDTSKNYLKKNGVNMEYYKQYHTILASKKTKIGKNVSQIMLEKNMI